MMNGPYDPSLLALSIPVAIIASYAALTLIVSALKAHFASKNTGLAGSLQKITLELQEARGELVTTARQAGKAEIANNVLHNVGNVLNSVNISAGLIGARMRDSKDQNLAKAIQLMNEHATDLGDFLTRDEKGKTLPGYLNKIVATLAAEKQIIAKELASMTRSIDHIKEIVATQQSYSGKANLVEPVQIKDLMEDALRMNTASIERHQITVVKDFADVPLLLLDKHLVLQILVNLIGNAKQAMDAVPDRSHQLTLRMYITEPTGGPRLTMRVEDNGEGIAPENQARLFAHGFTTRKNGHGFGLHSCAMAAKEMNGTMTAHSDGLGHGAAFALELPVSRA
jgi:signal transduction histidine kinase